MLLITITGLIVPATATYYDGIYNFHHVYKNGKVVKNKVKFDGDVGLLKTKNNIFDEYATSSKKKLKIKFNKISKIVLKIKQNGKTRILKIIKKPKKGWKLSFDPEYTYKNGKKVKTGKYYGTIEFNFKEKGKVTAYKDKGSIYLYNSKGKLLYKKSFLLFEPDLVILTN
jgi:hypothetical protein